MRAVDIISAKRDGRKLTGKEIAWFIDAFVRGEVADYQAAAWAMAVLWRGMDERETTDLTMAMVGSGERIDLSGLPRTCVDKHSTGGVGDKTTLVVAPVVAAAGLTVAKMSGRGLGFSGGTLDKLEAIPGMNVSLTLKEFLAQAREIGIVVAGQTADLVPADGKLYALRDVTATVPSLPLIASSIMSKKIAGGAEAVVLDVKVGRGAFMETEREARELARLMMRIGERVGLRVTSVLSDMSQPLGRAVGNALEVQEAIDVLCGGGPTDFAQHCIAIASEMLLLGGASATPSEAQEMASSALSSGEARKKFEEWIAAQGGAPDVVSRPDLLPTAPVQRVLVAEQGGYLGGLDARAVGLAAVALGAGRRRKGDEIDPSVGIVLEAKVGDLVEPGQPLMVVCAATEVDALAAERQLLAALDWSELPVLSPPLILDVLRSAEG